LIDGRPIAELLDRFAALRRDSVAILRAFHLTEAQLEMTGTHPELGPVTLRQLLATWVVHDLGHIAQLMRILAYEYRGEIGPWRQFVTIVGQA
jgi:hypothetical protein